MWNICQKNLNTNVAVIRVFPELYKVGNIVNKGLHGRQQNKFSKKNELSRHVLEKTSLSLTLFHALLHILDSDHFVNHGV